MTSHLRVDKVAPDYGSEVNMLLLRSRLLHHARYAGLAR